MPKNIINNFVLNRIHFYKCGMTGIGNNVRWISLSNKLKWYNQQLDVLITKDIHIEMIFVAQLFYNFMIRRGDIFLVLN